MQPVDCIGKIVTWDNGRMQALVVGMNEKFLMIKDRKGNIDMLPVGAVESVRMPEANEYVCEVGTKTLDGQMRLL